MPKGRLFPLSRDELVECAALVRGRARGAARGHPRSRDAPLDVLAQQIVAEAAAAPIHLDRLFALVRRAWPYRDLSARRTSTPSSTCSRRGFATAPRPHDGALLHRDAVNGRVKRAARRAARRAHRRRRIPDSAQYA